MFYCDQCAVKVGWPWCHIKSSGRCEICEEVAICNDRPSKSLPDPDYYMMQTIRKEAKQRKENEAFR